MPHELASEFQLDLFLSDAQTYREALARYELIRPILKWERTLAQHSQITGLSYWRLWHDLRRFRGAGIKPRHDFLDACAELTRPCLVNINSTSNHAVLRHDEPSTYGRPSIHIQGLTAIRHGRLKSALM